MSAVMDYSPMSVGIAYLPFCAVLVAALAASAPLVSRHGHGEAVVPARADPGAADRSAAHHRSSG